MILLAGACGGLFGGLGLVVLTVQPTPPSGSAAAQPQPVDHVEPVTPPQLAVFQPQRDLSLRRALERVVRG
jgi:hypothetical protein